MGIGIRTWIIASLLAFLLAADAAGVFRAVDNWMEARRFAAARQTVDSDILVVAIDSRSIARIGQWPWSRSVHAQIIEKLAAFHARQIALDIDFSSASLPAGDDALQNALKAAGGNVILAGFKQSEGKALTETLPLRKFADNAWIASVSVRADKDGIIRSVPFGEMLAGEQTPSMAAYLAQTENAGLADINVDFAISSSSFQLISAIDLIEGRVEASQVAGKDVIVGATAVELRDLYVTPTGEIIPGSILQALAAETAKYDRSIMTPGWPWRALLLFAFGLLGLLTRRLSWIRQLALYAAIMGVIQLAGLFLQAGEAISLSTTSCMAMLAGLAAISTVGELDFRKLKIGFAEKRLGATKALLQEVITDSPAGVIVVDDSNRIRVANPAARKILDAGKADWVGMFMADVLPIALEQLFDSHLHPQFGSLSEPRRGQLNVEVSGSNRVLEYAITKSTVASEGTMSVASSARCLTIEDVTERYEHMQRLAYLALNDAKTGARNRNSFMQDLETLIARGEHLTVVHIAIDRFKHINEDFGQAVGDQLLGILTERAKALLGEGKHFYRVAGDEFACLLRTSDAAARDSLVQSLLALGGTAHLGPYEVPFSLSIGVTEAAGSGWSIDDYVRRSNQVLSFAKANGGKTICHYTPALEEASTRRKAIEAALSGALGRQELHLLYQPQFDLASGTCVGVEALLRWTSPTLGTVPPSEFVPVAEQLGIVDEIGAWVMRRACLEISELSNTIGLAVNVSPRQFLRGNLAETIAGALAASGLAAKRLEIEITESVLAEDRPAISRALQDLRNSGIAVALDDFGTGYSSLSYLLSLPIDKIKIDRSFITGLPDDRKANAVLASILGVAKALNLTSIAEGVETDAQRDTLQKAGCQQGQGYLFAKPMRSGALALYLQMLGQGPDKRPEPELRQVTA